MLFSATATKKIEELTRLALKKEPLYVGVDDSKEMATVDGLEQGEKLKKPFVTLLDSRFKEKMTIYLINDYLCMFFQVTLCVRRKSDSCFYLHFSKGIGSGRSWFSLAPACPSSSIMNY